MFARGLAQGRTSHPALAAINLRVHGDPYVEGVTEATMAHGDASAAKGLEAVLTFVIELLARLIGDDMAMKLIARSLAWPQRDEGSNDILEKA